MKRQKKRKKADQFEKVSFQISEPLFEELQELLEVSGFDSMAEMMRHIMEGKPVTVRLNDLMPDSLLEDLRGLNKQLKKANSKLRLLTQCIQVKDGPGAEFTDSDADGTASE